MIKNLFKGLFESYQTKNLFTQRKQIKSISFNVKHLHLFCVSHFSLHNSFFPMILQTSHWEPFIWNIYSQFRKFSFIKILFNSERNQRKPIHIAMWSYVNTSYQCWMINKENWEKKGFFSFSSQIPFCICSRSL